MFNTHISTTPEDSLSEDSLSEVSEIELIDQNEALKAENCQLRQQLESLRRGEFEVGVIDFSPHSTLS